MRRLGVALVLVAPAGCSFLLNDKFSGGDSRDDAGAAPDVVVTPGPDGTAPSEAGVEAGPSDDDPYVASVLEDGPLSFWHLDETSGTQLADAMGKHDLTVRDAPRAKLGEPGLRGTAVVLDGQTSLLLDGTVDVSAPRSYTLEAWVRPASAADFYQRIFSKLVLSPTSPQDGMYLWVNGAKPLVGFERWSNVKIVDGLYGNLRLPADAFTHVVVTAGPTGSTMYIDGKLVTKSVVGGDVKEPAVVDTTWGDRFNGGLDELAFYEKVLTAERIKAHFDAAKK